MINSSEIGTFGYNRMEKRAAAKKRRPVHVPVKERTPGVDKRWMRRQDRIGTTQMDADRRKKYRSREQEIDTKYHWSTIESTSEKSVPIVMGPAEAPWYVNQSYRQVLERYLKAQIGGHWHKEVYSTNPWTRVRRSKK